MRSTFFSLLVAAFLCGKCIGFAPVSNQRTLLKHQQLPQQPWAPISKSSARNEQRRQASRTLSSFRPTTTATTTQLHMIQPALAVSVSAITALLGGFASGSLHAISGPDHLAALLPRCVGQRWYKSFRVGALWGMGHGVSAVCMGIAAYFLKSRLTGRVGNMLHRASSLTELAVGLSLIAIGLMGFKESREWWDENEHTQQHQSLSAAATNSFGGGVAQEQNRAIVLNGLLHGFSWDGAPSLAPALAVATWGGNLGFLLAYAIGTTAVMTVATTAIGEGTVRAGKLFQRPDLPQKLSVVSSIIATAVGLLWCGQAIMV